MDLTKNYELKKPSADDFADIGDLNANSDIIDAQMKKAADGLSAANTAIAVLQTDKADRSELPTTLPANGGNADTVNGHTVNADVPAGAKFTDTKYTHPTTSGNKHIPAGGSSGQILRWSADGTAVWGADNNTTYSAMTGATASAAGKTGLVPAPAKGAQAKYLRGDGTWQTPPDTNTTYSNATTSAAGLMSAADKTKLNNTLSIRAVVQGTISGLSADKGTYYVPYQSGASKALVEVWKSWISASNNATVYGTRYVSGISSNMTAQDLVSVAGGPNLSASIGVDAKGRISISGGIPNDAQYRVTWFI